MSAKVINYYACANSARGFVNFFEDNIKFLDKLYILKGGPGTGKSTLMKKIGNEWYVRGFDIEYIYCSSDNNSIDGVIVPQIGLGIVDGTAPHVIEPKAPGAIEDYVNLGEAWDSKKLSLHRDTILDIKDKIATCYSNAYKFFGEGLKIHDAWEKVYLDNIDFNVLDALTAETIGKIFGDRCTDRKSTVKNRLFGGATPKGSVDFVTELIENIGNRYFIKGRPGSGKSTMLKKIAAEAEARGFDAEVYHCGFDPASLDMVLLRELDTVIFDSTPPHEYFPEKDSDHVVDIYSQAIKPETDEKYKFLLDTISTQYKSAVGEGIKCLANAKQLHDELENYYIEAMDFNIIDNITRNLTAKIDDYFFSMC